MGVPTNVNLDYWFDVIARQLTGLDDPDSNLRDRMREDKFTGKPHKKPFDFRPTLMLRGTDLTRC